MNRILFSMPSGYQGKGPFLAFGGLPWLVPGPVPLSRVESMTLRVVDVLITLSREVLLVLYSISFRFQHQKLPRKNKLPSILYVQQ